MHSFVPVHLLSNSHRREFCKRGSGKSQAFRGASEHSRRPPRWERRIPMKRHGATLALVLILGGSALIVSCRSEERRVGKEWMVRRGEDDGEDQSVRRQYR